MELKKCIRCGCFFTTEDNLCPNCKHLKSFIEANGAPSSVQELSFQSGLSLYDINRYLKESEFSGIKKSISMSSNQAAHLDDQLSRMNKKENL